MTDEPRMRNYQNYSQFKEDHAKWEAEQRENPKPKTNEVEKVPKKDNRMDSTARSIKDAFRESVVSGKRGVKEGKKMRRLRQLERIRRGD